MSEPVEGSTLPAKQPRNAARILSRERERRALELRKAGVSYERIAAEVGYRDHTGAAKAVKRAMDRLPKEAGEDLRTLTVQRLEHMLVSLWGMAMQKVEVPAHCALHDHHVRKCIMCQEEYEEQGTVLVDHPEKFRAVDRILQIQMQLAQVQGLKPPEQVQHNVAHSGGVMVISGDKADFIAGMKKLAGIEDLPPTPIPVSSTESENVQVPSKHGPQ